MLKGRPRLTKINESFSRVVSLPFHINNNVLSVVSDINGICKDRIRKAGSYDIYYEIEVDANEDLVDKNVLFAMDEYMKEHHEIVV
jgi:hypothetical protein